MDQGSKGSLYLEQAIQAEIRGLNIDDAFALYLMDVSRNVVVNYYKFAAVFIFYLRKFFNMSGWDLM
jgi:hypothetical protein